MCSLAITTMVTAAQLHTQVIAQLLVLLATLVTAFVTRPAIHFIATTMEATALLLLIQCNHVLLLRHCFALVDFAAHTTKEAAVCAAIQFITVFAAAQVTARDLDNAVLQLTQSCAEIRHRLCSAAKRQQAEAQQSAALVPELAHWMEFRAVLGRTYWTRLTS